MHAEPNQRERNADARQLVAMIAAMDMFSVAIALGGTLHSLRNGEIPPLHAQAIFDAAIARLDTLIGDQLVAGAHSTPASPGVEHNSSHNKRLHTTPVK